MTSAAQIYAEADGVRSQTGVDPAIVATIAQTESNLAYSPWTLGITHAASKGGAGAAGSWIPSPNDYGGTQPSGFWSYTNGADAAEAFGNYIRAYQPNLAPLLNNAEAFFNPTGPILNSNYYVPTAAESSTAGSAQQATINYYAHWFSMAQQFSSDPAAAITSGSSSGTPTSATSPTSSTSTSSSGGGGGSELTLAQLGPFSLGIGRGVLWSILFVVGGLALIGVGIYLTFRQQINTVVTQAGGAAAASAADVAEIGAVA